jgi:excinuclease ABC subunit B
MVAILDADKTGFLRSETSLVQTIGRAARNVNALVVMYADRMTPQMQSAIDETNRRRAKQVAYNEAHGLTPQTIRKAIRQGIELELKAQRTARSVISGAKTEQEFDRLELITMLEKEMLDAAARLEFEAAAKMRDQIAQLKVAPTSSGGRKVTREEVEAPKPKAGMARSKVGMTGRGRRRG